MIHFLYGSSLTAYPKISRSMFQDRAAQFHKRLAWDVEVNKNGEERDEYDDLNPLYVIVVDEEDNHAASVRFLPTTGRTMVNDHFVHVTDGVEIRSPYIWECTRFCISPGASPTSVTQLVAAGAKLMLETGIDHIVGVFDSQMQAIYRRIGAVPTVIGWSDEDYGKIGVGLWEFNYSKYQELIRTSGISELEMEMYVVHSDVDCGNTYGRERPILTPSNLAKDNEESMADVLELC